MSTDIIIFTEKAKGELNRIFAQSNVNSGTGVRIGVIGGGCSGLSYKIDFGQEKAKDLTINLGSVAVYIDPKSAIYLKGVQLDFQDGLNGKGFVFSNPNAKNTCGCGESFSV